MTVWHMTLVAVLLSVSCLPAADSERRSSIVFAAESDPGVPLGRVEVFVNGASIGQTDETGHLQAEVHSTEGRRLRIEHQCPDGHDPTSAPKSIGLRDLGSVEAAAPEALEITLRCRPRERLAAFVVRTKNQPGLPILLDGALVGRTNDSGVAHFSASGVPGTEFVVEIDTTERPILLPQSPKHLRTLPDGDEIFVVNQTFDLIEPPRRGRKGRPRIIKIE